MYSRTIEYILNNIQFDHIDVFGYYPWLLPISTPHVSMVDLKDDVIAGSQGYSPHKYCWLRRVITLASGE